MFILLTLQCTQVHGFFRPSLDKTFVSFCLWTKLSFCFGGLITVSLFHTPWKVRKLPSHQTFFCNQTFALVSDSARPIDYSISDRRVVFTPVPTPCSFSSLAHAHRFMVFFHNQTFALATQILASTPPYPPSV